MVETITLLIIALIFGTVAFGEHLFLRHAAERPAVVLRRFASVAHDESDVVGDHDRELGKKLRVRLEHCETDGRQADITVPEALWTTSPAGTTVTVWAFNRRPFWMVWSPMIRYRQRPLWRGVAGALAVACAAAALV